MNKSVKERILLILKDIEPVNKKDDFFGHHESTQMGIAEKLDINTPTISIYLRDLQENGLVRYKLMNIQDRPRSVRCYYLSKKGHRAVKGL